MIRRRSHLYLILLLAMSGIAKGQTLRFPADPAPDPTVSDVVPNDTRAGSVRSSFAPAAAQALTSEEFQAEKAAAPPREPDMPAWGNYLRPDDAPIALPPMQYEIVGPPNGYTQRIDGQTYRRTVADPNSLLSDDVRMDRAMNLARPDGLAPIGVINDHMLPVGAMLISYRYWSEGYDGNYVNTHRVSTASLAAIYPAVPTHMLRTQQVALLEYGVTQDLTMTAWMPFTFTKMHMSDPSMGDFDAAYNNPGDIKINALLAVTRSARAQSHAILGINIPGGMIFTQTQDPSTLPYAIRNTSGTYDLLLGYTYRYQADRWSAGAQLNGIVREGSNVFSYRLGNELQLTAWVQRPWSKYLCTSARFDSHVVGNVVRSDGQLDPTFSPANLSSAQGYEQIDLLIGGTFFWPGRRIPSQYFSFEAGLPVLQSLEGPQLGLSWIINAGWNMIF